MTRKGTLKAGGEGGRLHLVTQAVLMQLIQAYARRYLLASQHTHADRYPRGTAHFHTPTHPHTLNNYWVTKQHEE